MANEKVTNAARVRKLEQLAKDQAGFDFRIIWDDIPDSELEPGTLVMEWGPNDKIISYRIKREGSTDGKINAKTS